VACVAALTPAGALFDRVRALYAGGKTLRDVTAATGWQISLIAATSLCKTLSGVSIPAQAAKVQALKHASPSFIAMRQLAMRVRGSCGAAGSTSSTNGGTSHTDAAFRRCSVSGEP
jgi:hypothetical protein